MSHREVVVSQISLTSIEEDVRTKFTWSQDLAFFILNLEIKTEF
jgi:hypothetical protein